MNNDPELDAASLGNPAASADPDQGARQEIEERARVVGRKLSRSWLARVAAVAAGLVAAWLTSRRRVTRRARTR
jgi:hypothetical protein